MELSFLKVVAIIEGRIDMSKAIWCISASWWKFELSDIRLAKANSPKRLLRTIPIHV